MMLVMVDADILVEALCAPKVFVRRYGDELWGAMKSFRMVGFITPLGYDRLKIAIDGNRNASEILSYIREVVEVCFLDNAILEAARSLNWTDFEAAVEYLCARQMELDAIVTLDPQAFALNETPVHTIVELLATMPLEDGLDRYRDDLERLLNWCETSSHPYRIVHLSPWVEDKFDGEWITFESLLGREPAFSRDDPDPPTLRGKILDLGAGDSVALVMGIKHLSAPQANVWVDLFPDRDRDFLPDNLQLEVLDEEFEPIMQAEYQNTSNIRLKFTADRGDYFSLKIRRGDDCLSEHFLV